MRVQRRLVFQQVQVHHGLENQVHGEPDTTGAGNRCMGELGGDAFIEVSDIVFDREEAIALGKEREEEAIWDFKNNCEIKLT